MTVLVLLAVVEAADVEVERMTTRKLTVLDDAAETSTAFELVLAL